jgi:hypothetical protein
MFKHKISSITPWSLSGCHRSQGSAHVMIMSIIKNGWRAIIA